MYTGNSIVDYLRSVGQATDYASRSQLAKSKGISNYSGTAEQNTLLLNMLRGSGGQVGQYNGSYGPTAPQQQAQPQVQQQPQVQPQQQASAQAGGQPQSAQDLINMGYYGYQGWDNAAALADFKATGGQGKGGPSQSGSTSGLDTTGFLNTPTINLPEIYQSLYSSSGISDLESTLSKQTQSYNDAVSKINDNPFLSEASRTGRLQKLQTDFNNNTANIRNDIATKKADIETQINLQTKQFDINSQQAQQALSQFQTLLQSGSLDNLSGEEIANITRSTGLTSSMIQSAIDANKKKNVQTQIISFDDGTNQGFTVIDSNTGEIIKTQTIAQSKPSSSGGGTAGERQQADQQATTQNLVGDIQRGATLRDLIGHYAVPGGLTVEDIYRMYNTYSPYGTAKESIDEVKQGQFVS